MTVKLSVDIKNARCAAIEAIIGEDPVLKIRTGDAPAGIADADSGTVLSTLVLPTDWLVAPDAGAVAKSGTWQDLSADATGTAGHFRIYAADGTTPKMQGTVTLTGNGGDMTVDNLSFVAGQEFEVTGFTLTDGN